ncbi:hypothetical protein Ancab_004947 [Ancistrocladus abbreviatus]
MAAPRALTGRTAVWNMMIEDIIIDILFIVLPMLNVRGSRESWEAQFTVITTQSVVQSEREPVASQQPILGVPPPQLQMVYGSRGTTLTDKRVIHPTNRLPIHPFFEKMFRKTKATLEIIAPINPVEHHKIQIFQMLKPIKETSEPKWG